MSIENWENIPLHPLCEMLPEMSEEEYSELVSDIKANGLQDPITLFEPEEGEITLLDGRNRRLACMDAGVVPDVVYYEGDDPLAFVISKNIKRRHLSAGQLAAMASDVANMKVGDNQFMVKEAISREKAAMMFGTTEKSISRFRTIQENDPDLADQVRTGEETLNAAWNSAKKPSKGEEKSGGKFPLTEPKNPPPKTTPPTKEDVQSNVERMQKADRERLPTFKVTDVEIDDLTAEGQVKLTTGSLEILLIYSGD